MDLLSEIKQSGAAMQELVRRYFSGRDPLLFHELNGLLRMGGYKRFVFTGMGSSLFAAFPACQYLKSRGIDAIALESGEFLRFGRPPLSGTLVIAVSQSGHSKEVVELCRALGGGVLAVTNYEGNEMYELGKLTLPICAGAETKSSSKTYTNTLAVLLYIAHVIAGETSFESLKEALGLYAADIDGVIAHAEAELDAVMEFLGDPAYLPVVAGGPSYSTASQAEILIMEISRICSSRYTCGQFMHGTVEILDATFRAIVLDFQEESRQDVQQVIVETIKEHGKLWLITDRAPAADYGAHVHVTVLPGEGIPALRLLSPILEIEPIILYTDRMAKKKGLRPGELRTVQK